jgi:hypothetical protein
MNIIGTSGVVGQKAAPLTEAVTLGACRLMRDMGFSPMMEVKTSLADLRGDAKWPEYLAFCDCFYFAVPEGFALAVLEEQMFLPERAGLIVADRFGGAVRRMAAEVPMNGARRRVETLAFARRAAGRLHRQAVEGGVGGWVLRARLSPALSPKGRGG